MDKEYWDNFYKNNHNKADYPSLFANHVYNNYLSKESNKSLLELGCGNGRDCLYFSRLKHDFEIYAVDQSSYVINFLKNLNSNINFFCDDFADIKTFNRNFDYIYSRFTLHSITNDEETKVIEYIANHLNDRGLFFLEARSIKDEIFGLGEKIDDFTYIYNNHSRRFLVFEKIISKIEEYGFKIVEKYENKDLAPYNDSNPVVIRVIAKRMLAKP